MRETKWFISYFLLAVVMVALTLAFAKNAKATTIIETYTKGGAKIIDILPGTPADNIVSDPATGCQFVAMPSQFGTVYKLYQCPQTQRLEIIRK